MSKIKNVIDINGARYELAGLLGRGGQGVVYAVKGGRLAVKLINGKGLTRSESLRNQLMHVRRLPLGDLSLAKPLEMLRPPHVGYIMELLTGMVPIKSLLSPPKGTAPSAEWYQESGGLRRRLMLLGRVANVMARLHGKGLAYSDPSPANIFISEDIDFDQVWFIDTDNLCYESAPQSKNGIFTPFYGAPELVRGESGVSTLTDMHSFAVIAFQILTLAHPFIGDFVNDGEPELEEQALAGEIPWIEDGEDDRNHASFGIPRSWVLSPRLRDSFSRAFGAGRVDPQARPGASEWAERLFAAADATITCPECGGAYYLNQKSCTWCDASRPGFTMAVFYLWDPEYENSGGILNKPKNGKLVAVRAGQGAVCEGESFSITRRLAFGEQNVLASEPVMAVKFAGNKIHLKSLDEKTYRLSSISGKEQAEVGNKEKNIAVRPGQTSWQLHFGDKENLHRVVRFEMYPGKKV